MENQMIYWKMVSALVLMTILMSMSLTGCGEALPADAKATVFDGFEVEDKATIHSAQQAELLQEDLDIGVEEAWCVNVTFTCWSCDYGQYQTCADSRIARLIDGEWQVSVIVSDEDKANWEARGCEPIEDKVSK